MKIFASHYKNNGLLLVDLITYISLICTQKYSTRLTKVERSKLIIPCELNDIIIGLLLGDGHIQKRSISGNSRFIYAQSSLRIHHLNYFNHILELFKPYLSKDFIHPLPPTARQEKEKKFTDKRTNKVYSSVSFATLSLPCFNHYRSMFYNSDNLKIVPINIENLLTPRGLAYWIMDDGSLQNKGLHLNTYSFTSKEVLILKKNLRKHVWRKYFKMLYS